MAPSFTFPADLHSDDSDSGDHLLSFSSPIDLSSLRPVDLEELVKGVAFDLSEKEIFCVEEQQVFDRVYSLVKGFSHLNSPCKFNLAETLRSNLSVLLPNLDSLSRAAPSSPSGCSGVAARVSSHRNALKIYTFFLLYIVLGEESRHEHPAGGSKAAVQSRKKNHLNSWNWESYRGRIINLIANSLEINLSLLFGSSEIDENYLSFVSRCVFTLYENQTLLKDSDSRESLGRIIGAIATKYYQTTQACASILHLLHKFDFVVNHIADAVAAAENKYGDGRLAVAIIREIGRTDPKDYSRDGVGAENVGRFLVELADRSPKLVSMNVGVLVPHFGGESYKIRNALVGIMGKLVVKAFRDVEGDVSSKSLRLRGKQAMLEILIERCRDVSAYTRSRVLQVWAELCEEHAVSIGLWNEIASVASGRLEDKSAMVRKSALNLLISMLQHNPFGPQLRIAAFEATLEKYKEKLCQLEPSATSEGGTDVDAVHRQAPTEVHEESVSDSCLPHGDEMMEEEAIVPDIGNLEQIRALVASLEAGLRFAKCVTSTMATLVQLLASSSITDVEYTIHLLMRCKQFQIDGSEACLRKMLPLVFSHDKSIYEAVENAFITIYIRKDPEETAKNLLNLALDSSIGDLAALECLVGSLVTKGEVSTSTMSALWNFFSFNSNGVIAAQSRGALSILCMALKSTPGILGSHLQDIVDIGFGRWAKEEPLLARTACVALDRLSDEDKKKLRCGGIKIFSVLQSLLTGSWLPESVWYAAADKAIKAIYSIHPTPEIFAAEVVKKSISSLFSYGGNDEMPTDADSEGVNVFTVSAAKLGRCLFIISHVAFNQLVYIESCIHKLQKQRAKDEKSKLESEAAAGLSTEASEKQNINAELGLGASEDAAIDALSEKAEKEIVSGGSNEKNLIGLCATFLSKLCRNFNLLQKFPELHASAMLALCRLMIIDADFCEANLQLLFTVVENAPSETVRSNCTLALGDLAVRFPNLLEPWTENIYARLRDPSVSVRKNAVLVLSHLILNDMMKVKGYINEMAMRIEDEENRISSLAKLFFHELSKKGSNPIYNLLPDILGRLSDQKNIKKDSFRNIMQFLINSIKKDKQMEALVEKLCNRFSGVSDKTQWECIAYCLSQLTFTEKGMKKLMDAFKTYEHVLLEDSVVDHFKNIISKSKKFAKPELKSCIDEFEEKLNRSYMERKEQEEIANNAHKHQQRIEILEHKDINERSIEDGSGEVINPAEEATSNITEAIQPDANGMNSEESCVCSILTECDDEDLEFQSPKASHGISKGKPKRVKGMIEGETGHRSMRRSSLTDRR